MKKIFETFLAAAVLLLWMSDAAIAENTIRVVVFGDSLTAGYKLQPEQAFPARLDRKLKEIGYSNVEVINMSTPGQTSGDAMQQIDAVVLQHPDVILVELGINDALRGIKTELISANINAILDRLTQTGAYVLLMGVHAPAGLGEAYVAQLDGMYEHLANVHHVMLFPNILEGISGNAQLTLADGMHPNPQGVEAMVEATYRTIDGVVRWKYENMRYQQQYQQQLQQSPMLTPPATN